MKVEIVVKLKSDVLDPAGDAVRAALEKLGFEGVLDVRISKLIELELAEESGRSLSPEVARKLDKMCHDLLANPVIEDYEVRSLG